MSSALYLILPGVMHSELYLILLGVMSSELYLILPGVMIMSSELYLILPRVMSSELYLILPRVMSSELYLILPGVMLMSSELYLILPGVMSSELYLILPGVIHVPYERIEIAKLDKKLERLSINYPIAIDEPIHEKNEILSFEEDKNEPVFYINSSEKHLLVEDKQSNFTKITSKIMPLEEGFRYHKYKNHAKAWQCIKENADIGNKDAIFWKGYYLTNGYGVVDPDPDQAMKLYKEAADYGHVEAQYRYAALLLKNLKKDDDEETKKEKCEKIVRYYKSAAENKNADAMYSLGDIYFNGKLRVEKNEQLGLEYLKSAADLKNDKA
ncbi:17438_t:CDS:2, partial [Gigaspora margarita]